MVRLSDIAAELGLSLSVVSRALSEHPDKHAVIREETRKRIQAYAFKVGYQPNRQASFLGKRGKSANLLCFLPDYPTRLINDLLFGISETASSENFPVNFVFGKQHHDLSKFIDYARNNAHAGLLTYPSVMMAPEQINSFREYSRNGGNILLLNTISNSESGDGMKNFQEIPTLNIDEELGGRLAASHLISQHADIIYLLTMNQDYIYGTREKGFTEYCQAQGQAVIRISLSDVSRLTFSQSKRYGFFADCDYTALDLYPLLASKNVSIGKNILICGFDDIFYGRIATPSLTTIHQPMRREGQIAVRKLVRMIYGKRENNELLSPHLLYRESTGGSRPDPAHPEMENIINNLS